MAISADAVGHEARISETIGEHQSASAYGNTGLEVLGSPALVGLLEVASMTALNAFLDESERSVGSSFEVEHTAPTPLGAEVTARARIESVDGHKVWFAVSASDASGEIASGRHARFVVDDARFRARVEKKSRANAAAS